MNESYMQGLVGEAIAQKDKILKDTGSKEQIKQMDNYMNDHICNKLIDNLNDRFRSRAKA